MEPCKAKDWDWVSAKDWRRSWMEIWEQFRKRTLARSSYLYCLYLSKRSKSIEIRKATRVILQQWMSTTCKLRRMQMLWYCSSLSTRCRRRHRRNLSQLSSKRRNRILSPTSDAITQRCQRLNPTCLDAIRRTFSKLYWWTSTLSTSIRDRRVSVSHVVVPRSW